ncbi:MAG: pilus assembly protein [Spirochaetes bacterium GWF1_41_5]|nr:MAG: pilus assembly protein [Spirochaetes bacterium GWF1_41_5]HBE03660.1 pilus assembly protein [Spirochaetia bacterium]
MKNILIDAGPIISLYDKTDKFHLEIKNFLKPLNYQYIATWPVITEALHMLSFNINIQIDLLTWISIGGIKLFDLNQNHINRIIQLTEKYIDIPMDLADASLIIASEELNCERIISIDSDYEYYKNIRKKFIENIFKYKIN